jgi:hypothetical protein
MKAKRNTYTAAQRQKEVRNAARAKANKFCEVLDAHLFEAERNDNPAMADLCRTFLKALRTAEDKHQHVMSDGTFTITLDLLGPLEL